MSGPVDVLAILAEQIDGSRNSLPHLPEILHPKVEQAIAEVESVRAAVAELIEATTALRARLCLHGDWEDRCFYYNGYSAPELMAPMADVDAALARVKGGAA